MIELVLVVILVVFGWKESVAYGRRISEREIALTEAIRNGSDEDVARCFWKLVNGR